MRCGLITAVFLLAGGLAVPVTAQLIAPVPVARSGPQPPIALPVPQPIVAPPAQPVPLPPPNRPVIARSNRPLTATPGTQPGPAVLSVNPETLRLLPTPAATARPGVPVPTTPELDLQPVASQPTGPALGPTTTEVRASPAPMPAAPPTAETPRGQTASIYLEWSGPPSHNVGTPFSYQIVVRNPGPATLVGVRVEEIVPQGVKVVATEPKGEAQGERLVWNMGSLEANGERRITVQVQPSTEGEYRSSALATFSAAMGMRTRMTRPTLKLTKTGPKTVQVGDKVPFTLEVTNTGSGPASNILLHDDMPVGLQHPAGASIEADVGTLAPGESKTIQLEAIAIKAGRYVNEATVVADGGLEASAQAEITIVQAALQVRKTGPDQALLQRELEYRIEVSNPGQATATNVRLNDIWPEGLDFLAASDGAAADPMTRRCEWLLGSIEPGGTRAVLIKLRARKPGDWVNQAVAVADRGLEAKSEAPVSVEGVPALMLEVVDLDDPVEVGNETVYEVRVVNQGNRPCLNVQIQATIADGLEPLGADGPAPYKIAGQQVTFEPLAKLAGKADAIWRVKVRGKKPGDWRMKVQMTCDQLGRPVYEEESTQVYTDFQTPPKNP